MKLRTISAIVTISISLLSSCANNDNIYNGMYNIGNQMQPVEDLGPTPSPGNESLTYEQYKKERQELIKNETN